MEGRASPPVLSAIGIQPGGATGSPRANHSNHNSIHAERPARRGEAWNRPRFYQRSVTSSKVAEIPLLSGAIEVQQVCLIAGGVAGKPRINVRHRSDAALRAHSPQLLLRRQ